MLQISSGVGRLVALAVYGLAYVFGLPVFWVLYRLVNFKAIQPTSWHVVVHDAEYDPARQF